MGDSKLVVALSEITTVMSGYDHTTHESGKQTLDTINEIIKKYLIQERENTQRPTTKNN